MKNFIQIFSLVLFLLSAIQGKGQINESNEEAESNHKSDKYFMPSVSFSIINYTDFATSPLAYIGVGANGGIGWLWDTGRRENFLDIDFIAGITAANAPISDYFQTYTSATMMGLNIYDHYLFQVFEPVLPEIVDVKIGGAIHSTTYFRLNESLNNNGNGIESIFNLMFSAKSTFDISRNKPFTLDFFLFKKTFKPVKRDISLQFNAGLLNLNYRPGYAYNSDAEINGSETNILEYILDSHSWSINGCRFVTKIEYARFRPSGNGYKWAYVWDVAVVPGKFETFQIATHKLQYTIIINCH
ncbi:MAG: hypothetical protein JW798_15270 [Prolixibacteraceae bacterium]|nr:hypothetical protein [Prolixibacteraceae bacterium]